jgi:predicted metal-binding protein
LGFSVKQSFEVTSRFVKVFRGMKMAGTERVRERGALCGIRHFVTEVKLADYLRDYRDAARFMEYCKTCNRYGACWSCPPFEFDTEEYLSPYGTAYVIGTKIVLDEKTIEENRGWEKCMKTAHAILKKVRPVLDRHLLALEKRHPVSRAFFAGTCHICSAEACTRIEGRACIAPEKIRPSLESFGFDIGKTSAELLNVELQWSRNGLLPEYLTLVSGFFTRQTIPDFSLAWSPRSISVPAR